MAGINQLAGIPWHKEFLSCKEGDHARHRKKCVYYSAKENYCTHRVMQCMGASHCDYYKETTDLHRDRTALAEAFQSMDTPSPFEGIRMIRLSNIKLGKQKLHPPSSQKVDMVLDYYKKYRMLDKPIVVSYRNDMYILKDRYVRYIVAHQLGLKYVPARMESYTETVTEEKLRTVGRHVQHEQYGNGVVIKVSPTSIVVSFCKGKEKTFDIESCVKNKTVKPI